jgi:hypothetical protein
MYHTTIHILYFVQFYVAHEFFEVFVDFYAESVPTHWPFFWLSPLSLVCLCHACPTFWPVLCWNSKLSYTYICRMALPETFWHHCTYLFSPWSRVLLEKLTSLKLVKKFPAFYGTRRFITAFTSARHLSLSWASPIQSIPPHPTSWKSEPALYRLLTFQVPSLMSLFRCLSVQVWGFVNISWQSFSQWGVVSPSPNPQARGAPLVGSPRLLIQYIRSYPPYWRPFLHLQPEDVPCRGDGPTYHMGHHCTCTQNCEPIKTLTLCVRWPFKL